METIEYLNKFGLDKLVDEFAIKVSSDERFPDLLVLNYNQIDSPKNHPIVKECRSLVVNQEGGSYSVVSRSFDRFFNQGENGDEFDLSKVELFEKVDGSLVSVFYVESYGWLYRTKSMIMPSLSVQGWDRTWEDLIETCLDWVNISGLDKSFTYIFEVVGRENRVVVNYKEDKSYLLAVRNNKTGAYSEDVTGQFNTPRKYTFNSTKECLESLKELPNLEEGYVGYIDNVPVVKIKSPQYLAAHRLRGEGLTPRRIMEMVVINEWEEYLSVFPEDRCYFDKYLNAWSRLEEVIIHAWMDNESCLEQKHFALNIKDLFYSGVLFQTRSSGRDPLKVLHSQKESFKLKLLETAVEHGYDEGVKE